MTSTLIEHGGSGKRVRRGADEWRKIIQRQRASGLTQTAFCAGEGLAIASFCKWLARLRDDQVASSAQAISFVPVDRSVGEERAGCGSVLIRLDLGGGMVLEVSRG